ncbi:MAG: hypothetical protein KDA27_19075, partial [Candidatus Eisenbacteria bacterium]|nr:hypothetical protein [Candidatus Eisenbacteria bacterium]
MAGRRILSSVVLALIVSSFSSAHAQCDPEWQDGLQIPGVTGDVWSSTTWDPDGPGPEPEMVVIGGRFLQAGGVETHNLAGWDGTHWRDLGSASVDLDLVHSLTVLDGELIAVGSGPGTRGQGHIYAYDGNTWRTLGNSTDRGVTAAAVYNGDLYIGGAFTSFGSHIARWSGSTWLPVSAGGTNAPVSALVEFQGELVAGGSFFTAGGQVVYNIAAFDGSTWHGFDGGFSTYGDAVAALAVYDGQLYAAGDLTSGSGNPLSNITRWNGSSWESIGGTASGITIGALRSFGGGLVASGEFTAIGGVGASGIATWDGQAWHPMGTGLRTNDGWGQIAHTLVEYDGELVAAGWFTTAGGVGCLNVASWSGTAWRSFGRGFNGEIRKLLADGPDVYIGGDFSHVDGHSANSVCRWDGSAYHALGSGLTGSSVPAVWDMVFYNGDLIVGGSYDYAGGSRLNGLAAWNGTEWTSLNGAFPFFTRIYALEEHDGMLIA